MTTVKPIFLSAQQTRPFSSWHQPPLRRTTILSYRFSLRKHQYFFFNKMYGETLVYSLF